MLIQRFLSVLLLALLAPALHAKTILVLGDSLSSAYNLKVENGWVHLLQQRLDQEANPRHRIINASISGETTAGGLSRLPAALIRHKPDLVILALGANDGLRGLSLKQMKQNLSRMITLCRNAGAAILLTGIQLPPNYGPAYNRLFTKSYTELHNSEQVKLIPFLLRGVGGVIDLVQSDGLHPTAEAQPIIMDNVWSHLEPMLVE